MGREGVDGRQGPVVELRQRLLRQRLNLSVRRLTLSLNLRNCFGVTGSMTQLLFGASKESIDFT